MLSALALQVRGAGEMPGEQLVKLLGTKRLREIETLCHRAAEHSESGELVLGLYPRCHRRYTHRISQVDDGPDDRRVHRTVGDTLHKCAIDPNLRR